MVRLTIEDVASLPEDFHYELLDGVIVPIPPSLATHQDIIFEAMQSLRRNASRQHRPTYSVSVAIGAHDEPRPDVLVLHARSFLRSPVPADDVILACEVLREASEPIDRGYKMRLYARGGIPSYWIIDPLVERVTLTQYLLGPDGVYHQHMQTHGLARLDQPWRVELDLPAITRVRDEIHTADHPYK